jgi:hypothetical protein
VEHQYTTEHKDTTEHHDTTLPRLPLAMLRLPFPLASILTLKLVCSSVYEHVDHADSARLESKLKKKQAPESSAATH